MIAPQWYAKALVAAVASKKDIESMIARFIALIKRNGDWSNQAKIIKACETAVRAAVGKHLLEVASAHTLGGEQLKMLEREFSKVEYDHRITVDPSLIGGARCTIDDAFEYDATLERMMRNMFARQR